MCMYVYVCVYKGSVVYIVVVALVVTIIIIMIMIMILFTLILTLYTTLHYTTHYITLGKQVDLPWIRTAADPAYDTDCLQRECDVERNGPSQRHSRWYSREWWYNSYLEKLSGLLRYMITTSRPSGLHSHFLLRGIDAITIRINTGV